MGSMHGRPRHVGPSGPGRTLRTSAFATEPSRELWLGARPVDVRKRTERDARCLLCPFQWTNDCPFSGHGRSFCSGPGRLRGALCSSLLSAPSGTTWLQTALSLRGPPSLAFLLAHQHLGIDHRLSTIRHPSVRRDHRLARIPASTPTSWSTMARPSTRPTFAGVAMRRHSSGASSSTGTSRRSKSAPTEPKVEAQAVLAAATAILSGLPSASASTSASTSTSGSQPESSATVPPSDDLTSSAPQPPPPSPLSSSLASLDPMVLMLGRRGTWAGKNPKLGFECLEPQRVIRGFDGPTLTFDDAPVDTVEQRPRVVPETTPPLVSAAPILVASMKAQGRPRQIRTSERRPLLERIQSRQTAASECARLDRLLPPRGSPLITPLPPSRSSSSASALPRPLANLGTDATTIEEAFDNSAAWDRLLCAATSSPPPISDRWSSSGLPLGGTIGPGSGSAPWKEKFEEWGFASPRERRSGPLPPRRAQSDGGWQVIDSSASDPDLEYTWTTTAPRRVRSKRGSSSASSAASSQASVVDLDDLTRSLRFPVGWARTYPGFAKALVADPPVAPLDPGKPCGVWVSRRHLAACQSSSRQTGTEDRRQSGQRKQRRVSETTLEELRDEVADAEEEGKRTWEIMKVVWERDVVPRGDRTLTGFKASLLPYTNCTSDSDSDASHRRRTREKEAGLVSRTKVEGRMSASASASDDEEADFTSGAEEKLTRLLARQAKLASSASSLSIRSGE